MLWGDHFTIYNRRRGILFPPVWGVWLVMGDLLDVVAVHCDSCGSAGFVFYGTEGSLVMPCECEGE